MAISRTQLNVEAVASWKEMVLQTEVDLKELVTGAMAIHISHDYGKFVCVRVAKAPESLYYSVFD
jgi:pyroglutamyl-peptidase